MVPNEEIKQKLGDKRERKILNGYLVCNSCQGAYELQPGEKPEDFDDQCECGGKLKYVETLESIDKNMNEMEPTISCPRCGTENPEDAKLCKSCKRLLIEVEWKKSSRSNNKQKSTGGTFETWNEQSNGVKALSIITVCCIGLILIFGINAMFSHNKNNQNNLSTQTASWSNTVGYAINSAVNDMTSYYNAAFKNFFQNLIKTGSKAAGG